MAYVGLNPVPQLKRRLADRKRPAGDVVLDVDRRLDGIRPKILIDVLMSRHGASHLHENLVEPLRNPILLRRVGHRGLVRRAVLIVESLECVRHILAAIVGSLFFCRKTTSFQREKSSVKVPK